MTCAYQLGRNRGGGGAVTDSGLACIALIARIHGKSAEPAQLRHALGLRGPAGTDDLLLAAKHLHLKARCASLDLARVAAGKVALPCIIALRYTDERGGVAEESSARGQAQPGSATVRAGGAPESGFAAFALLVRIDATHAIIHEPAAARPRSIALDELRERMIGAAIHLVSRSALPGEAAHFDFTWFIPAIVKYRALLGEALIASLFVQLFALVTPLLFQVVMDKVLVHKGYSTLTVIAAGMLAVVLFESVLAALRNYVFAHTASRIDVELGSTLFRHLLALPLAYFEARRVGDSVARVRELENIRQFLTGPALTSMIDLAFTAVFLALMLYYSPLLTVVVVLSIPCYAVLMALAMPLFRRRLNDKFARGADNQSFLVEAVTNMQTLKAGATEPQAQRRWDEQLAGYVAASFRVTRLSVFAGEAIQMIQKLVTVGILWLGAYEVIDGAMTVGALIAFNMLAGRVSQPVIRLAQLWQELQQSGIAVARLGDILNTRPEPSGAGRTQLPAIVGEVEFDQVRFRYRPDGSEVLRGISFLLKPGAVLGLVGRSGSGKSTIAKLAQRLYVPERGRILVDGVDLALADPAWLRRQIGVVLQENRLFARSVRENIALADPGMPMDTVINAATMAGAHEFILELPEGYDTVVGEQGATLSGGQRQRIAIARALITNPRILIFDEATAALDYESERVIQDNMRFIARGRTVIIIAHRLSAVRDAHTILVMEQGEIVEGGSHAELLKMPQGRYARLYAMQGG